MSSDENSQTPNDPISDLVAGGRTNLSRRSLLNRGLAITAAVTVAPTLAGAEPRVTVKRWDHEFDVIVIGFGVSGGAATYEAMQAGAKVLVLDRGSAGANESHGGIHYLGGGTKLQKAMGVEDTQEEMVKYLLAVNAQDPDQARVHTYVDRCLDNYRWLESIGTVFTNLAYWGNEIAWPIRDMAKPAMRGHTGHTGSGKWIQKSLLDKTNAGGVTQLLSADAQRLVQGDDGVIQGVIAEVDGKAYSFRARRGVILATGGFALNRDMISQYAPDLLDCMAIDVSANDGWGIRAAAAAGGALRRMHGADVTWPLYPPMSRREGILVNAQGVRFMPEESYYGVVGYTILREQHGVAHLIVDQQAFGDPHERPTAVGSNEVVAEGGIAEIERALKIPAPALQQTMETYNRHAAAGDDPFFRKEKPYLRPLTPPFKAIKASIKEGATFAMLTLGGVHTTTRSEALDDQGKIVPGLYAVGRTAAGIPSPNYFSSGVSLGECVCFGRLAGIAAAANKTL